MSALAAARLAADLGIDADAAEVLLIASDGDEDMAIALHLSTVEARPPATAVADAASNSAPASAAAAPSAGVVVAAVAGL